MIKILLIAAGGAIGAVLRYVIGVWVQSFSGGPFPTGTFSVNMLGCFLIGLLGGLFAGPIVIREEYQAAVMIGVLGAMTTFSTYAVETVALTNDGYRWAAIVNILLSNAVGLSAVWVGYRLAERFAGA